MAVKAIIMFIPSTLSGVTPKMLTKILSKVVTKVWAICCNNAIPLFSIFCHHYIIIGQDGQWAGSPYTHKKRPPKTWWPSFNRFYRRPPTTGSCVQLLCGSLSPRPGHWPVHPASMWDFCGVGAPFWYLNCSRQATNSQENNLKCFLLCVTCSLLRYAKRRAYPCYECIKYLNLGVKISSTASMAAIPTWLSLTWYGFLCG